ncbi:MAG: hypothetical protein ACUVV4_00010 [Candidatus Bathyarchaeia archaeon]
MKKRLIWLSSSIFSIGCLLDHFTTAYGLEVEGIHELNSIVITLQEHGLWEISEFLVVSLGLFSVLLSSKNEAAPLIKTSLFLLMVTGFIRLVVGFQNIMIILNALTI